MLNITKQEFLNAINYVQKSPSKMIAVTKFGSHSAIDFALFGEFLAGHQTSVARSLTNPAITYTINMDNVSYINATGDMVFDGGCVLADAEDNKGEIAEEYYVEPRNLAFR